MLTFTRYIFNIIQKKYVAYKLKKLKENRFKNTSIKAKKNTKYSIFIMNTPC